MLPPPKGGLLCFPRGGRQRGGVRDDTLPALKHNLKKYHVTELSQTSTQACAHTYTLYNVFEDLNFNLKKQITLQYFI